MIDRFVEACSADERILASFLGGSRARGEADEHSDVDLCVIAKGDAFSDVVADRTDLVRRLGVPLFLEDFGLADIVFFVLADGTEGEIFFGSADRLHEITAGAHRTLFDREGILDGVTFPDEDVDPADQGKAVGEIVSWFWHDLSHFIAAIGREHRWWAAGQLEALRGYCVNIVRIEHGAAASEEPYDKLDRTMPIDALSPLETTFAPLERADLLHAARTIVRFFRARASRVAETHGQRYPVELDRLTSARLDRL